MGNKLGRNELCPCGSNKKYKRCCMAKDLLATSGEAIDFSLHKLRQTEGEVIDKHLMPYVMQELPEEVIIVALAEFHPGDLPKEMDKELVYDRFFIPWLLFNWIPKNNFEVKEFDTEKTIAQNYIERYEGKLDRIKREFIEGMNQTYYSFYIIEEVGIEKYLIVKDIILGKEYNVKERLGTHFLRRGDIIFSRILTLEQQSIFIGMAPYSIPIGYQRELLEYKQWLIEGNGNEALSGLVLREYFTEELIDYYFEIMEECYDQPLPKLKNTDGDMVVFSRTYFDLTISPYEVLKKLLPLTLSKDIEGFSSDAEYNSLGEMVRVEFPWLKKRNKQHKSWENTVMGNILVEDRSLILETNSLRRTEQGKKVLNKYLGNDISFQRTVMEAPERMSKTRPNTHNGMENELLKLPEVQKQLKEISKAYWEDWFDKAIPALDNKTPRQAAKSKRGREQLEILLSEYEYYSNGTSDKENFLKVNLGYLKKKLKL